MQSPRLRLRVTAAAETVLRAGHPWVFAGSIRGQNRPGECGELGVIYDRRDRFLAIGLYDPESPIRVRVLHAGKPATLDDAWWSARLAQTLDRRRGLFDERTTGHRWINGESDGWPGLVLDRYDATLVLKLYTAAWLPRLGELSALIWAQLKPARIILRVSRNVGRLLDPGSTRNARPRRRGSVSSMDPSSRSLPAPAAADPSRDGEVLRGPPLEGAVTFLETGLCFEADVLRGQKTGFFLDQRDNRRNVESLAGGRRVLNAFSFSGGFSLYAARGGAVSVTDLDISAHALAGARRNFALNESIPAIGRCRHEGVQADALDWLRAGRRRQFDLIVLDPPSFAKRETERPAAIRAYEKLAGMAIQRLARGGILVACSCSAHVTAPEFFAAVRRSAAASKRSFDEMRITGHAPDHPATFREADYLKAIYLRL
ncbi:MAG: class I SAM-dependent methyltransferase [Verrucomicrobiota bacterium]|jgi:23S rRNA (cytosine1962-C5)-methyltransferase